MIWYIMVFPFDLTQFSLSIKQSRSNHHAQKVVNFVAREKTPQGF